MVVDEGTLEGGLGEMAGDWMAVRLDLARDPAVLAMAMRLEASRNEVVGALIGLWSWANEQLVDGNAVGVTLAHVDDLVSVTGFADALVGVGWLEVVEGGIRFPHFDTWNTESAKKRLLGARRAARHRSRDRNAESVTNALPTGEERRVVTTPLSPQRGGGGEADAKHPEAVALCRYLGDAIAHWKADARIQTESKASIRAMDCMLRIDKRKPERVREVITWLFRGGREDYQPKGDFDWRPNVQSGAALRKHYDKLDYQMDGAHGAT